MKKLLLIKKEKRGIAIRFNSISKEIEHEILKNIERDDAVLMVAHGISPRVLDLNELTLILNEDQYQFFVDNNCVTHTYESDLVLTKHNAFISYIKDTEEENIEQLYEDVGKTWKIQLNDPNLTEEHLSYFKKSYEVAGKGTLSLEEAMLLPDLEFGKNIKPDLDEMYKSQEIPKQKTNPIEEILNMLQMAITPEQDVPEQ